MNVRIHPGFARRLAQLFSMRRFVVYQFDLRSQPLPDVTPTLRVSFSTDAQPVMETLRAFPNEYEMESRDFDEFQRQLSEDEICFSAWVGSKLAFHGWIQFRYRKPSPSTQIPISAGGAFIHRCSTHAAFRGRKIFPSTLVFAFRELKSRRIERVFIDHAVENSSSRRGIEYVGALPIGNYTLFSLCFARWARFDPHVQAAISDPLSEDEAVRGAHAAAPLSFGSHPDNRRSNVSPAHGRLLADVAPTID